MDDLTIRTATPADVPEIQYIAHEGWQSAYADFLSGYVLESVRREWHTEANFRRYVTREDGVFFVAEADGDVAGYVSGGVSESDQGTVDACYVDPARWNEGIGARLFERTLDALNGRGVARVTVEVFARNERGRAFYESQGFAVVDEYEEDLFGESAAVVTYAGEV